MFCCSAHLHKGFSLTNGDCDDNWLEKLLNTDPGLGVDSIGQEVEDKLAAEAEANADKF